MRGIDVSSYQKKPDWSEVKESGIEFAILRIMDSKGEDASLNIIMQGVEIQVLQEGRTGIAMPFLMRRRRRKRKGC